MESVQKWVGYTIGVAVLYLALTFRWVPKPYNWVIEINIPIPGVRTFNLVWGPGIHFLWIPIKPFYFVRSKVDMAQKRITLHMGMNQGAGRADPIDFKDTKAKVLAQVIYQVVDPIKATYNVQEDDLELAAKTESGEPFTFVLKGYERATLNRIEADLRSFFGSLEFDQANEDSKKADTETVVLERNREFIEREWGIRVLEVDIIDFILDDEAAALRQKRLFAKTEAELLATVATGEKNAAITRAQGTKEATILVAQGDKEAAELAGAGEQGRLKAIAGAGLDPEKAAGYSIAQSTNEAIRNGNTQTSLFAVSEAGKLALPVTLAGAGRMLGGSNQKPPSDPTPQAPQTPPSTPPNASSQGTPKGQQGQQPQQQRPPRQQSRPQRPNEPGRNQDQSKKNPQGGKP